jgi:hypothetical protein
MALGISLLRNVFPAPAYSGSHYGRAKHWPTRAFEDPVPHVVEDWIHEQARDPDFIKSLESMENVACRNELYLYALDGQAPKILVPKLAREPLIRFTHERMFHLGYTKVTERLSKSYFWPSLRRDVRHTLNDCPVCEVDKARRHEAHGLFRAKPVGVPRARYAMDFQGQGKALTGESEALGFINTATPYVTVIALQDRKVATFIPAFLDRIVFQHEPPEFLHSDEAPEFMSALMLALAEITETTLTTTMGHNARSNGIIEVF